MKPACTEETRNARSCWKSWRWLNGWTSKQFNSIFLKFIIFLQYVSLNLKLSNPFLELLVVHGLFSIIL